ncbi:membrane-spanning 4-domains subfamily A member 3-like isoform X2 [Suricata suricatta]|uniref:membrane-spanning 4-domains subfamily A member 3-like isoform X2 n=1 Tax=Suricata suricatta TaxID=37032 RepID=UPI0011565602|nr:membrane-spanning 4-domains subfamily A member 3-like isoform X2 [Suricata suricatta]
MTQSVPDTEESQHLKSLWAPHLCVLERTSPHSEGHPPDGGTGPQHLSACPQLPGVRLSSRMREIVGSRGIAVDISSNQSHGIQLGKAVTSDTSGHTPNKLQRFLKENLKQLGVAQIMIGVKFIFYGITGTTVLPYVIPQTSFFSFQIGFPIWAALSFIISGSMTVVSAKKQTKALLRGNLRANILSAVVSSFGILILSYNVVKIIFMSCEMEDLCSSITSVVTGLVVILMILNCLQLLITLALSMLSYNVKGKRIDWVSALCFLKSASESPYQGMLHQPSSCQNLERKDTLLYYNT